MQSIQNPKIGNMKTTKKNLTKQTIQNLIIIKRGKWKLKTEEADHSESTIWVKKRKEQKKKKKQLKWKLKTEEANHSKERIVNQPKKGTKSKWELKTEEKMETIQNRRLALKWFHPQVPQDWGQAQKHSWWSI